MMLQRVVELILSNTLLRQSLLYFIVGLIAWTCYLSLIKRFSSNANYGSSHPNKHTIHPYAPMIAIAIALTFLLYAIDYVGYLPYGPDTSGYPSVLKKLLLEGHYHGKGYYASYHTSAILFSMCAMLVGSQQIAYAALLSALLISLILVCSAMLSRLYRTSWRSCALTLTLLFISSPPIGGFDLLQQYVASVYAAMGVTFLLCNAANNNNSGSTLIMFVILISICIVTHLTPVLLAVMLIAAYYTISRNKLLKVGFILFLAIAVIYTLFAVNPTNILESLYNVFTGLKRGAVHEPSIRAYEEIASSRISLLSWTLLPSITLAYIATVFLDVIKGFLMRSERKKCGKGAAVSRNPLNRFAVMTMVTAMTFLSMAIISKTTPTDLSRYFCQPSYMIMLLVLAPMITKMVERIQLKKRLLVLVLFLILMTPYTYAALNDPLRLPQKGELRLAPVTLIDRIEMLPLAKFGINGYHVYAWHDVAIPTYLVENPPKFVKPISYYPVHDILTRVAKGQRVNIPYNSYIVVHREVVARSCYINYDSVYMGPEHIVLVQQ